MPSSSTHARPWSGGRRRHCARVALLAAAGIKLTGSSEYTLASSLAIAPAAQLSEALDHTLRGICSTPMRLTLFVVVAAYAAGGNDEQEPSDNALGRMSREAASAHVKLINAGLLARRNEDGYAADLSEVEAVATKFMSRWGRDPRAHADLSRLRAMLGAR